MFSFQSASGMKNKCYKNFRRNFEPAVRYGPDGSKQIGLDLVVRNKAVSTAQQNRAQLFCRKRMIEHQNLGSGVLNVNLKRQLGQRYRNGPPIHHEYT